MPFINFLDISSLSASQLAQSPLVHHLVGHEILHVFFSLVRSPKRYGLSRAQQRKYANRRKRWFVDNIIMHHKRLHDRNRQIVIASARSSAVATKLKRDHPSTDVSRKWRERMDTAKDRKLSLRGRIEAKRLRARSRWVSVSELQRL